MQLLINTMVLLLEGAAVPVMRNVPFVQSYGGSLVTGCRGQAAQQPFNSRSKGLPGEQLPIRIEAKKSLRVRLSRIFNSSLDRPVVPRPLCVAATADTTGGRERMSISTVKCECEFALNPTFCGPSSPCRPVPMRPPPPLAAFSLPARQMVDSTKRFSPKAGPSHFVGIP